EESESESEFPTNSEPERGDKGMSWEGREYAQGPPELEPEVLLELDRQMELKELDRLLGVKVLQPMNGERDREGKVRLQCKYVLDWRYRNGWVRRARLVAKEYRFLEPSLTDAQLLLLQVIRNSSLELLSLDITDAYLQVKQRRPMFIQTHIGDLELCYNLPGQRAGVKDWFTHLLDILKEHDLKSFDGNPSLFGKVQDLALNSHVDDLQILASKGVPMKLANELKTEGLKVKVDGPVSLDGGCSHFLKKKFQGFGGSIEVIQDTKYAERLQSILGLEKAHGKQNPSPPKVPAPGEGESVDAEHLHVYKRCVGILMYMSAERPDLQYIVKVLSSRGSSPTSSDFGLLRHVVKYIKLYPVIPIVLQRTVPGKTLKQKWDGVDPDEPETPVRCRLEHNMSWR
ncbi:true, partial [Symbiodinium necroappetens]